MLFKTLNVYRCYWLPAKQETFLCSTYSLELFLTRSSLFQLVPIFPLFTSDDVTECFALQIYYKSTLCEFCNKVEQVSLQIGEALMCCKVGQVLLQSGAGIRKCWNFYDKLGVFITEPRNIYYKVVQVLQLGALITKQGSTGGNERHGEGNGFSHLTP